MSSSELLAGNEPIARETFSEFYEPVYTLNFQSILCTRFPQLKSSLYGGENKNNTKMVFWFCVLGLHFFGFVLMHATYSLFAS